jgi:hypothetical protein
LPELASLEDILAALRALLPELAKRAASKEAMAAPALRSVYAGAATRVQELITAESRAAERDSASAAGGDADYDGADDDEVDVEIDADDDDIDDDDLLDDEDDHR